MTEEKQKTTRVQIEMANTSFARLNYLKAKTEAASYAEVMKNALRLYEAMIERAELGEAVYMKASDGTLTEYRIF